MQIIVIGKSFRASALAKKLSLDKNNIVFADCKNANSEYRLFDADISNAEEVADFATANAISLVILTDLIPNSGELQSLLLKENVCCLVPSFESEKVFMNRSFLRKFAYKNRIQTPKFILVEREQAAYDYIKSAKFPLVLIPERKDEKEPPFIAETKSKAQKQIEKLFARGNKKILIDEYIESINYNVYLLFDWAQSLTCNLIETVSYFDEISTNKTSFVRSEVKYEIKNVIMPKIIDAILEEEINYAGVLGLNFIIDKSTNIYLAGIDNFFSELDLQIAFDTIENNILDVLLDAASFSPSMRQDIKTNGKTSISIRQNGQIITKTANSFNRAVDLFEFEGYNTNMILEAKKYFSYLK